ncbi:hypothetical protein RJ639_046683 [Escallonia herrerae]|uniref:Myb/SANT-like domain-containing protein n=1 Tax=Escallonia herrerae TaxID=1293975 RepID=A0AA89AZF7_9ASTE|nr:hypothetical protein RJ639_046683 [Escallonia herrerae]
MASRSTRLRRTPHKQQPEPQARAKWTASLTKILADVMVDQVHKGNRQKSSFSKKGWRYICEDFYKQAGLKWDKDQLKNRFAVLRKHYVITKSLLDEPNFRWDEATGAILGTEEAWNKHIMEHPDAETVRSTGCPIYKQLCTIFLEEGTNGKHNGAAEHEKGTPDSTSYQPPLNTIKAEERSESEQMANMDGEQDRFQSTTFSKDGVRKRGRMGVDNAIANAVLEMAAASKLRAVALQQCSERFSVADCVRTLDQMEGVNERVNFGALDLFNSRSARETFLSLKADKRFTWLKGKCSILCDP